MTDRPISTRPPSSRESKIQEKFDESIAGQSELMDALGRQLITLELAIPGLYATVLKLISGDNATLTAGLAIYITFGSWFAALALTLFSLIPRKWTVDRNLIQRDPTSESGALGIEDFFYETAAYKRNLLIAACLLFFVGVVSAALSVF